MTKLRVGVFATGLDTYWGQFEGLLDHLNSYREEIVAGIYRRVDAEVVDAGMVDNPDRAACAAELFREKGVDVVFLYVATYCLSSTILPVARALDCPLVLLNLQPVPAIDYNSVNALGDKEKMTGVWLEHCQACSIPEICNVLKRASLRYSVVTGYLADDKAWNEIEGWLRAASAVKALSQNRMGVLGHYYSGMLDIYT
ncbi:MAG: arabinose isomerase, partial [Candidatus Cryptobacteroides sp.]